MLPGALERHWETLNSCVTDPAHRVLLSHLEAKERQKSGAGFDRRTSENFSYEWSHHEVGDRTWTMDLRDRVQWFFEEPIRIPREELAGMVLLDAGCGNGSQSVAYTALGLEVIAIDLTSGLEHGLEFRLKHRGADPAKVHFVQGDLQRPPLAVGCVDLIHSAGVLHHTPDTKKTFLAVAPLLRAGGTMYVWLYKHEPYVTPLVDAIRVVTTRIPSAVFVRIARIMAFPFIWFCATVNALSIRRYGRLTRREAALALMDIFGAPYAHYHSFEEVAEWYRSEGFSDVWSCNNSRRGFGICGRLAAIAQDPASVPEALQTLVLK